LPAGLPIVDRPCGPGRTFLEFLIRSGAIPAPHGETVAV